jgi:hypothetical protein
MQYPLGNIVQPTVKGSLLLLKLSQKWSLYMSEIAPLKDEILT